MTNQTTSLSRRFPEIRLAHVPGAQGDNNLLGRNGIARLPPEKWPGILISYYYLDKFIEKLDLWAMRDWVLDSGAFSAYNSEAPITVEAYTEVAKLLLDTTPSCKEVYALDVIGDWKASLKNTEYMWKHDVQAIPCFHYGEPWHVLKTIARDYPKIAIGGTVGKKDKEVFAGQCFARVWPKRMHGFNFASERAVMGHPWESVDSTDWEIKPAKFGHWRSFGHKGGTTYMNWRGSCQDLSSEIYWYLELEEKARVRWKKEMEILEPFRC